MTKVITYDWNNQLSSTQSKYPWNEWIDGQTHLAIEGEDYVCKAVSFRSVLHSRAQKERLKLRTRTHEDGLIFQFSDEKGNFS